MEIARKNIEVTCPEQDVYHRLLELDNQHIVELGCGGAEIARDIASSGSGRCISAFEVDRIAHEKNLQITDLQNVTFGLAGAQSIPLPDESADVVMMFKSLHHVPIDAMPTAMHEIHRVLKPGGYLYISEPVYAGEFNEILRLFHDERQVREAAFNAIKQATEQGLFSLVEEVFFNVPRKFENFAEFEKRIIKVTHTEHKLDEDVYRQVKQRFEAHLGANGAEFLMPIRVDLLQRPGD